MTANAHGYPLTRPHLRNPLLRPPPPPPPLFGCLFQGFAALGLMGITIVAASGDSGAHGNTDPSCAASTALPDWPASSPYVLSVGATQVVNGGMLAAPVSPFCRAYPCVGSGTEVRLKAGL